MHETGNFLSILSNISLGYVWIKCLRRTRQVYPSLFLNGFTWFEKMTPEDFQKPEFRPKPEHFHPCIFKSTQIDVFFQKSYIHVHNLNIKIERHWRVLLTTNNDLIV